MWNLYQKSDLICVVFRDGTCEKLSPESTYLLSTMVENKVEFAKAMDAIKNNKFSGLEWYEFNHILSCGVEFSQALELIKDIIKINQNEKLTYKNKEVIIHGIKDNGDLLAVFIFEEYKFLNVKDKVIIDIGANICDTAIYFALNGAKKVIALEPYPYSFKMAIKNVKENNLDDMIEILNAGYGKGGEIVIDENFKSNAGTSLKSSGNGANIKIYSLDSLIKKFSLEEAILKMDCEGCEYNILNEDSSLLAKFSQIQIEYHNGYKRLVKKLIKAGFDVKYTLPKVNEIVGYIYASKP